MTGSNLNAADFSRANLRFTLLNRTTVRGTKFDSGTLDSAIFDSTRASTAEESIDGASHDGIDSKPDHTKKSESATAQKLSDNKLETAEREIARLREIAERSGVESYLIDSTKDVKLKWLKGKNVLGVTSGASAPEHLVQELIELVQSNFETFITGGQERADEGIFFKLPKGLRQ